VRQGLVVVLGAQPDIELAAEATNGGKAVRILFLYLVNAPLSQCLNPESANSYYAISNGLQKCWLDTHEVLAGQIIAGVRAGSGKDNRVVCVKLV
jgi:hypothetical protein